MIFRILPYLCHKILVEYLYSTNPNNDHIVNNLGLMEDLGHKLINFCNVHYGSFSSCS